MDREVIEQKLESLRIVQYHLVDFFSFAQAVEVMSYALKPRTNFRY